MNKFELHFIFLSFFLFFSSPVVLSEISLSEKYDHMMDKKDDVLPQTEEFDLPSFDWEKLKEKLVERNFTEEQKIQIFFDYYSKVGRNEDPININHVLAESIPVEIKKKLVTSKKLYFSKNVDIATFVKLRDFALSNNCLECIKKSYLVGNRSLSIRFDVKNIRSFGVYDTYYLIPKEGNNDLFAFLDTKKDGMKFGINDVIETSCNVTFHEEFKSFMFWHCRLNRVNNELAESVYDTKLGTSYTLHKTCGSLKQVQKKLSYENHYGGKIDGKFGPKMFFSLLRYNGTGDLDDRTCEKIDRISLPVEDEIYKNSFRDAEYEKYESHYEYIDVKKKTIDLEQLF